MPISQALAHDIGRFITTTFGDQVDVLAAGAGDATESDGAWVTVPLNARSAVLLITWETVLDDAETLTLTANAQDATDGAGAGAADYQTGSNLAATIVATASGAETLTGTQELRYNLAGSRGFVRSQVTPDLSRGATDIARIQAVWIFGGLETN